MEIHYSDTVVTNFSLFLQSSLVYGLGLGPSPFSLWIIGSLEEEAAIVLPRGKDLRFLSWPVLGRLVCNPAAQRIQRQQLEE